MAIQIGKLKMCAKYDFLETCRPLLTLDFCLFSGIDGGGFCPNTTVYCSFGCCGNLDKQLCCFPIGVITGCSVGVLGTVCLLITIFRCKINRDQPHRHSHRQSHGHSHGQTISQSFNDQTFELVQGNTTFYGIYTSFILHQFCTSKKDKNFNSSF